MRWSIRSFNIPPGVWTLEDERVQIPLPTSQTCARKSSRAQFKCPSPSQARFKFPSPGYRRHSNASKVPGGCWNVELIGTLVTLLSIKLTEYLRQESSIKQITTTTVEMPLRIRSRWILAIAFFSFSSSLTSLAVIFNVPFTWENKFELFNQRKFPQHWQLATNLLHKRMKGVSDPPPPSAPTI